MVEMLRNKYQKFTSFLRRRPGYSVIILFVFLAIIQLTINLIRNDQPFSNFPYTLSLFGVYLIGYLAFVITNRKKLQFLICFLFTFLSFMVVNIIEGSIVDYTSVILIALLSIFSGLISLLIAIDITKHENILKISKDSERDPKIKKTNMYIVFLILLMVFPLSDWSHELYTNGWSDKPLFNILIVSLFLIASYFIETRTSLSDKIRTFFYFVYFLIIGTFASAIIYQNQLNGQMIFLYLFLSFIGSLIWLFFCKQLNTKNKL